MNRAVLIRGKSGVGKSTVAKKLIERLGDQWKHIEFESFIRPYFEKPQKGILEISYTISNAAVISFLGGGYNIVLEGRLFFKEKYVKKFQNLIRSLGFDYVFFELCAGSETLISRNDGKGEYRKTPKQLKRFNRSYESVEGESIIKIENVSLEETLKIIMEKV